MAVTVPLWWGRGAQREPGFSLLWLNRSMTAAGGALDGFTKAACSTVRTSGGRSYEMTRCTPSAGSTSVDFATGGFSLGTAPGSVSSRAQPEDRRNPHQRQLPPPLRRQRRRSRPPQLRHRLRQPPRSDGRRSRLTTTWAGAEGRGDMTVTGFTIHCDSPDCPSIFVLASNEHMTVQSFSLVIADRLDVAGWKKDRHGNDVCPDCSPRRADRS